MATKILVVGAVNGQYATFFTKLSAMNSRYGPFNRVLCVGDFISIDQDQLNLLLSGTFDIPVMTYFLQGATPIPDSMLQKMASTGEICPNLAYLGNFVPAYLTLGDEGTLTSTDDLGIAFFGRDTPDTTYLLSSVQKRALRTDILVSSVWPEGIQDYSNVFQNASHAPPQGCLAMASAALTILPRYHFVGGFNLFVEREPFIVDGLVTRFISLGDFNNDQKERWFYAFFIDSKQVDDTDLPTASPIPYTQVNPHQKRQAPASPSYQDALNQKRTRMDDDRPSGPPPDHYTCNICNIAGHWIHECKDRSSRQAQGPPDNYKSDHH